MNNKSDFGRLRDVLRSMMPAYSLSDSIYPDMGDGEHRLHVHHHKPGGSVEGCCFVFDLMGKFVEIDQ